MNNYLLIGLCLLFLAGCYTGEVITVDTAITDNTNEQPIVQPEEPAQAPTPAAEEQTPEPRAQPPADNIYKTPAAESSTYTGKVIVKTGPSSYRIRLPTNKELRILSRENLEANDQIQFTIDNQGLITALTILNRPADITRY